MQRRRGVLGRRVKGKQWFRNWHTSTILSSKRQILLRQITFFWQFCPNKGKILSLKHISITQMCH
jgi:hypothetical protein